MFVNIPSGQNTGSCRNLAEYLNKESIQKNKFFNSSEDDIHVERVIFETDRHNRKALGENDSKFFLIDICPSDDELKHLIGRDVDNFNDLKADEKSKLFSDLRSYTTSVMDEYAKNFNRANVTGNEDLVYFAKIEVDRIYKYNDEAVKSGEKKIGTPKEGLNVHVHVVVSRKSKDGKTKLSPAYGKSRGNEWHLDGRGTVRRGFDHGKFKETAGSSFSQKFKYRLSENERYSSSQHYSKGSAKADFKKEYLKTVKNKDLKGILKDHSFTSGSQVSFLMKERGYKVKYHRGNFIFKKGSERVVISSKNLTKFSTPHIPDSKMKDMADRFNGFKFNFEKGRYKDENIRIEKVKITKKDGKTFEYYVLHDKVTKCSINVSRVKNYAYEHRINVYSKKNAQQINNKHLRDVLGDPKVRTYKQFEKSMNDRGYRVDIDPEKGFKFSNGSDEFFMAGSAIRSNIYGSDASGEFGGKNYSKNYDYTKVVKGKSTGKVKSSVENFVLRDNFVEERKLMRNSQQVVNLVRKGIKIATMTNPVSAGVQIAKELLTAGIKLAVKLTKNGC